MTEKVLPFTKDKLAEIISRYPTPFHIYDEKAIRENARRFKKAFGWHPAFKEYFAVKACPNPQIMSILHSEGFGTDCSSLPELLLSERVGITGEDIMFSSNDTPSAEFIMARKLGAVINLDDLSHLEYLEKHAGLPEILSFRYNPGPRRTGNAIIGDPKEAKYGFTREQLFEGFARAKQKGIRRFGLHAMVVSNELNPQCFIDTAVMMFELVAEISVQAGIKFEFVNLGGGVGIPYRPDQTAVDLEAVGQGIKAAYDTMIVAKGLAPLRVCMECGRMITGPYGYLVSTVLHKKQTYKNFVGLDSCMADLMRPALYGAYHHITVIGKEKASAVYTCDVTGSLCENNDKFAIDRVLPNIDIGDIVVIHDTGAHGYAMGFNYNGKLRSAELLLQENGSVKKIRRAETVEDYFATMDFAGI